MIPLLLVAVWFLLLLMVASLCMAAQAGDRQRLETEPSQEWAIPHGAVLSARSADSDASSQTASALARTAA